MYSYFAFHRLNATTTLEANRSGCEQSRVCRFAHRVLLVGPAESQEPTTVTKRYEPEKEWANMHCLSCHLIIASRTAWKTSPDRFYCSEFCADSEISAPFEQGRQKEVLDRQHLERLQRLLPIFLELKSSRVSPKSSAVCMKAYQQRLSAHTQQKIFEIERYPSSWKAAN